ncbi:MAG: tetratricopeptide repeat protein [Roseibacillus sp.]
MRTSTLIIAVGLLLARGLQSQPTLDSAQNALAESLPEVAVARTERYLASNPNIEGEEKTAALLLLGESYLRTNQSAKALETLGKVPDSAASARNYWQGMALAHQKEYQESLEKLSSVESRHPLYSHALFNSLELRISQNESALAFDLLTKLRTSHPEFLPSQLTLLEAQLYLTIGEPNKARTTLLTLEKEAPPSPARKLLAGKIELAALQPESALKAFDEALTPEAPARVKILALLGKCDAQLQTSAFEDALDSILLLLKTDESENLQSLAANRLELLVKTATSKENLVAPLTTFAKPSTLGEDGNLLSPQKLLACYALSRISEPARSRELLQLITTLSPEGELSAQAHLQLGKLAWENGDSNGALASLQDAQNAAPGSPFALKALDLSARIKTKAGDLTSALALFEEASQHPNPRFAEQALLNQALLTLATTPDAPLLAVVSQLESEEAKVSLELERALALAHEKKTSARVALQDFLFQHPDHPRTAQARLALTDILLSEQQPDFDLIDIQLASLPQGLERSLSRQRFRIHHELGTITGDWTQAKSNGERHRKDFPQAEDDPYFLLRLGESYYRNGDFNQSRILYSKVASLPDAGELVELALYYYALSNLEIPTPAATTQALDTLDDLIKRAGPLASWARLTKARTQLKDLGRAQECLETLEGIPGDPGDQPEPALLSAQAYRDLAAGDPELAQKAVSIYRRLLDDPRTSYPLSNQIHYQLSRTYSESGQPNLAIDPCLSVVDLENRAPDETEVEWEYYYRCGFEAIDILLEAQHNRAALLLARKLAQTKGPSADEAKERARQIQLEHQLFED